MSFRDKYRLAVVIMEAIHTIPELEYALDAVYGTVLGAYRYLPAEIRISGDHDRRRAISILSDIAVEFGQDNPKLGVDIDCLIQLLVPAKEKFVEKPVHMQFPLPQAGDVHIAFHGNKIQAIKDYRTRNNTGLKDGKDMIEAGMKLVSEFVKTASEYDLATVKGYTPPVYQ